MGSGLQEHSQSELGPWYYHGVRVVRSAPEYHFPVGRKWMRGFCLGSLGQLIVRPKCAKVDHESYGVARILNSFQLYRLTLGRLYLSVRLCLGIYSVRFPPSRDAEN